MFELTELLSDERWVRRSAIERLSVHHAEVRYALRRTLWHDPDATVRAEAATRLGRCAATPAPEVMRWLCDAGGDVSPLVREAVLRSLARLGVVVAAPGQGGAVPEAQLLCARLALEEPVWWARRAAVLGLAALAGAAAIPILRRVLADPFWRVRHAAVQALLVLGDARPELRAQILSGGSELPALAQSAQWYLRTRWQAGVEAVHSFPQPPPPDGELFNADPAVMTARLRARPASELRPIELLPLLAEAHQPLRALAVTRLRERPEPQILRAALAWLETPTQPHAAETVAALLDSLGEPSRLLCAEILSAPEAEPSPGALRWACRYVAATRDTDLRPALLALVHRPVVHPQARAAVIEALGHLSPLAVDELVLALDDPELLVRSTAAMALVAVPAAHEALFQRLRPLSAYHPLVGCALVEAARRRGDLACLRAAADEQSHPLVRSRALAGLAQLGSPDERAQLLALLADADPLIRDAVLGGASAAHWLETLDRDPDPALRRRALRLLCGHRRDLPESLRGQAAALACTASDPWLRTHGCELLDLTRPTDLRLLLTLSRDTDPAVRAAAASVSESAALADGLDLVPRLHALLAERQTPTAPRPEERAAAYALLFSTLGMEAQPVLEAALGSAEEPELVRAQLAAMVQLFSSAEPAAVVEVAAPAVAAESVSRGATPMARRLLGRTGIEVSPLGMSGAQDPPPSAFQAALRAGVNLFFWEPGYQGLGRFLRNTFRRTPARRAELCIVAGSFEGDRVGIERDVARALRRLGTDYLDVFLLLWVRSPERLSDEVRSCLAELKRSGRIRACGFSTHHRDLAEQAVRSGGWDVVMARHSAAHPGAEDRLLPLCAERGVGVLTFSALCYGRLLRSAPVPAAYEAKVARLPTAGECYRYSLGQPGVVACWSAPRSTRELRENLDVLSTCAEPLAADDVSRLREHGLLVRDEDRRWNALLRKGHEGSPQALASVNILDLLESGSAPAPETETETETEEGTHQVPATASAAWNGVREGASSLLSWPERSEKI